MCSLSVGFVEFFDLFLNNTIPRLNRLKIKRKLVIKSRSHHGTSASIIYADGDNRIKSLKNAHTMYTSIYFVNLSTLI